MKPLVFMVLVICTVVSMNLKLVSKRNSGKSQKIIFTFGSGPHAHAVKHFRWLHFVLHIYYLLCSAKKKKKVITGMAYLVNESGMKVSSRFGFFFFFFVKKNKTKENYQVETSTGGITMVIITLASWHCSNIQSFSHAKEFS